MWSLFLDFIDQVCVNWIIFVNGKFMFCLMEKLKRLNYVLKEINKGRLSGVEKKVEKIKVFFVDLYKKI